jgi:hypothetical protein
MAQTWRVPVLESSILSSHQITLHFHFQVQTFLKITLFFLSLSQSNLARIAALPDPESINSFHSSFALGKIKLAAIRKDVAAVD